jgi:HEAT repeat protein
MQPRPKRFVSSSLDIQGIGLARSEPEDLAPEPPLPIAEVADLFNTLDKAARSHRLYQPNNPVYHGFLAAATAAFGNLWDRLPALTVGVEEHAFRWYGRPFTVGVAESRESLHFLFFKDGLRFLTFLPGFEEELVQFLAILNRARSLDQRTDDDMVTLLWQAELTSFQYSYIDLLSEGTQVPQRQALPLKSIDVKLRDVALAGTDPTEVRPPTVEAGEPTVAGLVSREDFSETLYFLEPLELHTLRNEVALELERELRADVLNALFDRLEDNNLEWRGEILRILRQLLPVYLSSGDLRSAAKVLEELNDILERGVLSGRHRDDAVALFLELSEPAVLTQLLRSLEDGVIDPEGAELGVYLRHLGPPAMPVLLAAIERTELVTLQQRLRRAMQELGSAHQTTLVALLADGNPEVVRGAARLTGQLGIRNAGAQLAALLQRPDPAVRRAAVDALAQLRTAVAMDALQRALTDNDRDVRIAAARALAAVRYQPARETLTELLDSRVIRDADLTEKIAFFEAFGSVATPESVEMLDRMLNGKRLFAKQNPEIRACAAMALGRVGTPAAREALQRASGETNPMVRNAVSKALRPQSSAG